jgi:LTXXQ motif family protein
MPGNNNVTLRTVLLLSGIALSIVVEVAVALSPSASADFLKAQDQLMATKSSTHSPGLSSKITGGASTEDLSAEALHKSDKIRTAQFVPGADFPERPPSGMMDHFGPPQPGRRPVFPEGPPAKLGPQKGCLEDISRQMGIFGYMKSKLQISDGQKVAWEGVEDAVEASIGKLRAICETLPNDVAGPPGLIERSDFLEKQLAARLDFVRALKAPMQQLTGQLTADQRTTLDMPPWFPFFP